MGTRSVEYTKPNCRVAFHSGRGEDPSTSETNHNTLTRFSLLREGSWLSYYCCYYYPAPLRSRYLTTLNTQVKQAGERRELVGGIFFRLLGSSVLGAKKEGEKKEESSESQVLSYVVFNSASTQL